MITVNADEVPARILRYVPQANSNLEQYKRSMAAGVSSKSWMDKFFAGGEVILLLYPSDKEPGGLGLMVAKGRDRFERALAEKRPLVAKIGALVVQNHMLATVAGIVHGDMPEPDWLSERLAARAAEKAH